MFERRITLLDLFWLLAVAALSFSYSGLPYYPFLNSDIAVHVLMSQDFSFRYDLYYWGQDRLGSLVPATGYIFHKLLFLSPIWACSLAKWLYLSVGCVTFWTFIPARWQRWLFAILWFFPAYEMMYFLLPGHPYGEQMAFIGLALFSLNKLYDSSDFRWSYLSSVCFLISLWISDFSLIFIIALPVVFYTDLWQLIRLLFSKANRIAFLSNISILAIGAFVIIYAKYMAPRDPTYIHQMFASGEEFLHSLDLMWFYTINVLCFDSATWWSSLMLYSTIFVLVFLMIIRINLNKWSVYFIVAAGCGFILLMSLRWLAANYVMLKYFIPVFIAFWVGIFSYDFSQLAPNKRGLLAPLLILMTLGASGSLVFMYEEGEDKKLSYSDIKSFSLHENTYLIGTYWNSYVLSMANPEGIRSTPKQEDYVRNKPRAQAIIMHDTITIVKNEWFENAPDSLVQFGHQLVKTEKEWSEGKFDFVAYRNLGPIAK